MRQQACGGRRASAHGAAGSGAAQLHALPCRRASEPVPRRRAVCCAASARRQLLLGGAALAAGGALWPPGRCAADEAAADAGTSDRLARQLESRVTRFALPNGLTFLVIRRPESAPVVSVNTYCSAGAWVEDDGQTGVAHLLEHLAFKGTPRIGSRDWKAEAGLLRAADEVFYSLRDARRAGRLAEVAKLEGQLQQLQDAAQALVVPNAFAQSLTSAGAVGLNASTSHDCTRYYASLPANQLELWFALEAERFQAPVFRELYREKQVVTEERASRIDNSPLGSLFYEFALRSLSNNYRRPVLGFKQDLEDLGRLEVADFFARYYHPANVTIAIAGAVEPEAVRRLAERYFGGWTPLDAAAAVNLRAASLQRLGDEPSARPAGGGGGGDGISIDIGGGSGVISTSASSSGGDALQSVPPAEAAAAGASGSSPAAVGGAPRPLDYSAVSRAGPLAIMGFYRPSLLAPGGSGIALEVACDVLTAGRTGRLARLAQEGVLLGAGATPDYPAELHPGLALVTARPRPGDSPLRALALVQEQLDALADSGPTPAELARVKKASRTELLAALQSNAGLASALVTYEAATGSWRGVLEELAQIEAMTLGDVRDVAALTFAPANSISALVTQA